MNPQECINILCNLLTKIDNTVSISGVLQSNDLKKCLGSQKNIKTIRDFLLSLEKQSGETAEAVEVPKDDLKEVELDESEGEEDSTQDFSLDEIKQELLNDADFSQKNAELIIPLLLKNKSFIQNLTSLLADVNQVEEKAPAEAPVEHLSAYPGLAEASQQITMEDNSQDESLAQDGKKSITDSETALSKDMQEMVQHYNKNPQYLREKGIRLGLLDEEQERRRSTVAAEKDQTNDELPLQEKTGNAHYYAVAVEEDIYYMVPIKNATLNEQTIWRRAYESFFLLKNKENLSAANDFILKKPAVVKKDEDRNYYLEEQGILEFVI